MGWLGAGWKNIFGRKNGHRAENGVFFLNCRELKKNQNKAGVLRFFKCFVLELEKWRKKAETGGKSEN